MIEAYIILANRIRKELGQVETAIKRTERAIAAGKKNPQDQDFYIDSAALNLHDIYAGLERIFRQIAATVDGNVPTTAEWHRDLLQQMNVDLPKLRPPVLSDETTKTLDEYLRFRHVVRNVYTFTFDPQRIERLVTQIRPVFERAQVELLSFAQFLEQVGEG